MTTIHKTVFFKANPEKVWAFLTQKDKLKLWFHEPESDLAEGQEYRLCRVADDGAKVPQIWGKVLSMQPPKKLVYTFIIDPFNGAESTVTWLLEEAAGGTRLSLTHEGIEQASGDAALHLFTALDKGWDEHFADLRQSAA